QVLPGLGLLLGRADVVVDVLEVDPGEVAAPRRQRPREEVVERLVPELAHPLRLVLVGADRVDELVREPATRLEEVRLGLVRVGEAVLRRVVGPDSLDDLGFGLRHQTGSFSFSHFAYPDRSNSCASSGPPSSTIFPSTKTWTKSGSM